MKVVCAKKTCAVSCVDVSLENDPFVRMCGVLTNLMRIIGSKIHAVIKSIRIVVHDALWVFVLLDYNYVVFEDV